MISPLTFQQKNIFLQREIQINFFSNLNIFLYIQINPKINLNSTQINLNFTQCKNIFEKKKNELRVVESKMRPSRLPYDPSLQCFISVQS